MKKISVHAASAHGMKTVPAETLAKIEKAIKEYFTISTNSPYKGEHS
jgi:hypothetical protein